MIAHLDSMVNRLVHRSRDSRRDPYRELVWPTTLPTEGWCMPPELLSLYGTPCYDALDAATRHALSRLELIHFFSLNIHGETRLIAGLGARLNTTLPASVADYLAHFQEEETKHRACFVDFCERYGNGPYRDRNVEFPADWTPVEAEYVFFARVVLFEEMVDHYNGIIAQDERVVGIVRQVNWAHRVEEARHLTFGRLWLQDLAREFGREGGRVIPDRVIDHLRAYRAALWRDLFSPDVYREAGISDPFGVRKAALAGPAAAMRCDATFAATERFLAAMGCPLRAVAT